MFLLRKLSLRSEVLGQTRMTFARGVRQRLARCAALAGRLPLEVVNRRHHRIPPDPIWDT